MLHNGWGQTEQRWPLVPKSQNIPRIVHQEWNWSSPAERDSNWQGSSPSYHKGQRCCWALLPQNNSCPLFCRLVGTAFSTTAGNFGSCLGFIIRQIGKGETVPQLHNPASKPCAGWYQCIGFAHSCWDAILMKSKTSVLIAISTEMSKIPLQVQYLDLRPFLEMGISLLSYLTVEHLMRFLNSLQSATSQTPPFLSSSHSVPQSRLWGHQGHWHSPFSPSSFAGHIWKAQASGRRIHGGTTPQFRPRKSSPIPAEGTELFPSRFAFFFWAQQSRRTLQFDKSKSRFWVLLLD